jgi:hypothetical protein
VRRAGGGKRARTVAIGAGQNRGALSLINDSRAYDRRRGAQAAKTPILRAISLRISRKPASLRDTRVTRGARKLGCGRLARCRAGFGGGLAAA